MSGARIKIAGFTRKLSGDRSVMLGRRQPDDGSFYMRFVNKTDETRLRLSDEAVAALVRVYTARYPEQAAASKATTFLELVPEDFPAEKPGSAQFVWRVVLPSALVSQEEG